MALSRTHRLRAIVLVSVLAAALITTSAPASPGVDAPVRDRGPCSGRSHWGLVIGRVDADTLRVRFVIRDRRPGRRWRVGLDHEAPDHPAEGFFFGRLTSGADGILAVRRRVPDLRGPDTIRAAAWTDGQARETCSGRATF